MNGDQFAISEPNLETVRYVASLNILVDMGGHRPMVFICAELGRYGESIDEVVEPDAADIYVQRLSIDSWIPQHVAHCELSGQQATGTGEQLQ